MTGATEMWHENNNSIRHLTLTHFDAHERCIEENKDYGDDESLSPNRNQRQTRSKYRYSNGDVEKFSKPLLRDLVRRLNHDSTIACRVEALQSGGKM